MRITHLLATLTALAASVCAEVKFEDWTATEVSIGKTYEIKWSTDSDALERIIQLGLIRLSEEENVYWSVIEDLAYEIITSRPGGSIEWTPSDELEAGGGYGIFLISEPRRQYPWWRDRHQSEDQTNWFNITRPKDHEIHVGGDEVKLELV